MNALLVVLGIAAAFVAVLIIKGVRIVPEQSVVMIERLGKFSRLLSPGLNVIIPIVDSPREVMWRSTIRDGHGHKHHVMALQAQLDLREQVYDFPQQQVITKDNVGIGVFSDHGCTEGHLRDRQLAPGIGNFDANHFAECGRRHGAG